MKRFAITAFAFLLCSLSFAAPVITASTNGTWNTTATWNLNRLPQTADTVVIPAGSTVTVNTVETLGNVYLKIYGNLRVNGRLEMSASSIIVIYATGKVQGSGNNADRIRIGTYNTFKGDDADVMGPAMANGAQASFVAFSQAPLPVKFVSFSVARKSSEVLVQWATSEEIGAASFEVERSFDGASFTVIGSVAAAGNSRVLNNYSYTDKQAAGRSAYYRIRQVDIDGKASYTAIKTVQSGELTGIQIAATQGKVVLQFGQEVKSPVSVRIVNMNGQVISEQRLSSAFGQVILGTTLKGAYVVAIQSATDLNLAKQVIL